jgi:hypothetical protein
MDVVFDWNFGNKIHHGLITLRLCGFPFVENEVVSVLVINDTKLLMSCVKCFELGISNTCDEGVYGKEWWP